MESAGLNKTSFSNEIPTTHRDDTEGHRVQIVQAKGKKTPHN